MIVRLVCSHGTMSLSGTTGLTFSAGDGTSDSVMQFSGTTSACNSALSGLVFTPTGSYVGPAYLEITAQNDAGLSTTKRILLTVTTGLTITNGSTASIAENSTGTIATIASTGGVGAKSYSIVSGVGDYASFAINSSTGVLTPASAFNYEADNSYSVRVQVTDGAGDTATKDITVTVTDVYEDREGLWVVDGSAATTGKIYSSNLSTGFSLHASDNSANSHGSFLTTIPALGAGPLVRLSKANGTYKVLRINSCSYGTSVLTVTSDVVDDGSLTISAGDTIYVKFLQNEVQRITYTADGGTWRSKTGRTPVAYNISAANLKTEIDAAYSTTVYVHRSVSGSDYTFSVSWASETNQSALAPLDVDLYTSAAASPSLTVTTQGSSGTTAESFKIDVTSTSTDSFSGDGLACSISFAGGNITSVDTPTGYTLSAGGVGNPFVTFTKNNNAPVSAAWAMGSGTYTTLTSLATGDGVYEQTSLHFGNANYGTIVISSSSSIAYNASAGTVKSAIEAATSRTFNTFTGSGTSGSPWVITDTTIGNKTDLAITTNSLEVHTPVASNPSVSTIQNGA